MKSFLKLRTFAASFAGLMLFVSPASAAILQAGEEVSLRATEPIIEDVYAAGGIVSLSGDVDGDVLSAGGVVYMNADTTGDVFVGGGNVEVAGNVGGDARVVGGQIEIGGIVEEDLVVVGGFVRIRPDAELRGDVHIAGGVVLFDGTAKGKVAISGGEVMLGGSFEGSLFVQAEEVDIQNGAVLAQGAFVKAKKPANVAEGARITGDIVFEQWQAPAKNRTKKDFGPAFAGLLGGILIIGLLTMLVAGLIAVKLFPKQLDGRVRDTDKAFWSSVGRGFATSVVVPVGILILMITVLGSFIGAVVGAGFLVMILFAKIVSFFILGSVVWTHVFRQKSESANWKMLLIGLVATGILTFIPILGWIVLWIFYFAALGSIALAFQTWMKKR